MSAGNGQCPEDAGVDAHGPFSRDVLLERAGGGSGVYRSDWAEEDYVTTDVALGDLDSDGDVDIDDIIFFDRMMGPGTDYPGGCEDADFDGEGDVDLLDFARFQRAYPEP